jgi:hypothetical protein
MLSQRGSRQVQAEALLGVDGIAALINITDRILDQPTSNARFVTSAKSGAAAVRPDAYASKVQPPPQQ